MVPAKVENKRSLLSDQDDLLALNSKQDLRFLESFILVCFFLLVEGFSSGSQRVVIIWRRRRYIRDIYIYIYMSSAPHRSSCFYYFHGSYGCRAGDKCRFSHAILKSTSSEVDTSIHHTTEESKSETAVHTDARKDVHAIEEPAQVISSVMTQEQLQQEESPPVISLPELETPLPLVNPELHNLIASSSSVVTSCHGDPPVIIQCAGCMTAVAFVDCQWCFLSYCVACNYYLHANPHSPVAHFKTHPLKFYTRPDQFYAYSFTGQLIDITAEFLGRGKATRMTTALPVEGKFQEDDNYNNRNDPNNRSEFPPLERVIQHRYGAQGCKESPIFESKVSESKPMQAPSYTKFDPAFVAACGKEGCNHKCYKRTQYNSEDRCHLCPLHWRAWLNTREFCSICNKNRSVKSISARGKYIWVCTLNSCQQQVFNNNPRQRRTGV